MTPEQMANIFQPFEQVGDTRRSAAGTGLGLSISRHLAQMMGGDIFVESSHGKGSRFWVELTLAVDSRKTKVHPVRKVAVGYKGHRRTVLVVDDIAANRLLLADLLGILGFDVREADNGAVAISRIDSMRPDIVLMDVRMPIMDGLEAIRQIRSMPGLEMLPILAVSASATREDENQSLMAGANAFLSKPIDEGHLLDAMSAHIGL